LISTLYQLETTALGTFLQSRERLLMVPAWVPEPSCNVTKQMTAPLARLANAWMNPVEDESLWPVGPTMLYQDDTSPDGFRLAKHLFPNARVCWLYTGVEQMSALMLLIAALQRVQLSSIPLSDMKGLQPQFEVNDLQSCLRLSRTSRGKGTISRIMHEQSLVTGHWRANATRDEYMGTPQWFDERTIEAVAQMVNRQFFARNAFDATVAQFRGALSQSAGEYFLFGNRIDPEFTRHLLSDAASPNELRAAIWCSLCRVLLQRTVVGALRARNEQAALAWLEANNPDNRPDASGLFLVQAGRDCTTLSEQYAHALTFLKGSFSFSPHIRDMELRFGDRTMAGVGSVAPFGEGTQSKAEIAYAGKVMTLDGALQRFCWIRAMADLFGPNERRHRWPGLGNTTRVEIASRIMRTLASPAELVTVCEQIEWRTDGFDVECRNRDTAERLVVMMAAIVLMRFLERREPERLASAENFEQYAVRNLPGSQAAIKTALCKFPATELPPELLKLLLLLAMDHGVSDSVRGHAQYHKYGPETLTHVGDIPTLELRKLVHRAPTLRVTGQAENAILNISDCIGNYYLISPALKLTEHSNWALQRLHLRVAGGVDGEKALRLAERLRQYGHVIQIRNGRLESMAWLTNELGALSRRKHDWTDEAIVARTENVVDRILLNLGRVLAMP